MVIDGIKIAESVLEDLKRRETPKNFLAAVLAGKSSASKSFLAQKKKVAELLGIDFRLYEFGADISSDDLRAEVGRIANQSKCGGIIVQLPLPGHINAQYILNAIPAGKDLDVLGERSLGAFYAGRNKILPPSVATTEEILKKFPIDLKESVVAVVGAGRLIGKPMAVWLLGKAKEIIILDKGSDCSLLKKADVVILGAGIAGLVNPEMLKDGAGVIDFGYSKNSDGRISGDFDYSSLLQPVFYTPTPGGTGPILVAKILENFYKLNSGQADNS